MPFPICFYFSSVVIHFLFAHFVSVLISHWKVLSSYQSSCCICLLSFVYCTIDNLLVARG